jgi:hypothetical protein
MMHGNVDNSMMIQDISVINPRIPTKIAQPKLKKVLNPSAIDS